MTIGAVLAAGVGGYLLGSIPFGLVLVRVAGLGDIRAIGSGNIGATNVLRTGRKDLAAATLILDAGKAGIAALIAWALFDHTIGLLAGAAAFLGHLYPVWLKFQGGKGVATFLGTLLAAVWPVGALACLTWLIMARTFRYSSLAALTAAALAPVYALFPLLGTPPVPWPGSPGATAGVIAVLAVFVFWRHRANIKRLLAGDEPKIGRTSASKTAA